MPIKLNMNLTPRSWLFNPAAWLAPLVVSVAVVLPLRGDDMMAPIGQSVKAGHLNYLSPNKPDAITLLAPPPLPNSPEQAADMAEVQAVCHAAPTNDVAVAFSEKKFGIFNFTPAIGPFFVSGKFPRTEAFFQRVQKDAETVTDGAKEFYQRPRPYVLDPSLASGKSEKSFSYPSGHSTESMVLALVLAEVFPDRRDPIIAEARNIGWHRVEIARHYPTDIYAGRVLAQAIVHQMNKNDEFQRDLAAACAEVAAAQTAARN
jgi:acid phosphatase (class A)